MRGCCFHYFEIMNRNICYNLGYFKVKGDAAARKYSNEAALSLRSRRSGTKRTALFGLFAKCRRLPRGFLWNTSLPPLVVEGSTFEMRISW